MKQLIRVQEADPGLIPLFHNALDATEASKIPKKETRCTDEEEENLYSSNWLVVAV